MAEKDACVCRHSKAAHTLQSGPGCTFCHCAEFRLPDIGVMPIELGPYATKALELLAQARPFAWLPKDALIALVQDGQGRLYPPGTDIIRRGQVSPMLHIVLDGRVRMEAANGKRTAAIIGPGCVAGDVEALREGPRCVEVAAETHVETLEVDVSRLQPILARYPEVLTAIAEALGPFSSELCDGVALKVIAERLANQAVDPEHEVRERAQAKAAYIRSRWEFLKKLDERKNGQHDQTDVRPAAETSPKRPTPSGLVRKRY